MKPTSPPAMETSVEHATRGSGRAPKTRWAWTASASKSRSRRSRSPFPSATASHKQLQQDDSWAGAARAALAALAASAGAALVHRGWPGLAAQAARLLAALGLQALLSDAVVHMVVHGQAAAVGAVCITAAQQGAAAVVQQLCLELLSAGRTAAAAAVAEACWHVAGATGWQPAQTASLLAPPLVAAVDAGRVAEAGSMVQLLFNARMQPLLVWLLEAMSGSLERTDAAAAATWHAMQQAGGTVAAGDLLALLAVDRHHRTAAALAQQLSLLPGASGQVAQVLAAAVAQAVEAGRVSDMVSVCWLLFEEGQLEVLAGATSALTAQQPGGRECAGELSWHAMATGREQLVVATTCQMLLVGSAGAAAAALEGLYAAGHPQQAARVAAAALGGALDSGGSGVATVAAAQVLLWRRGQVPLLRDVSVALAHAGRAGPAAQVWWLALQQGEADMVATVLAAAVRAGATREAAELAGGLAQASGSDPAVSKAAAAAMLTAVRAGSASEAAALASQLLQQGHGELLRCAVSHLLVSGHDDEVARLEAAAEALPHSKQLAAMLAVRGPASAQGGEAANAIGATPETGALRAVSSGVRSTSGITSTRLMLEQSLGATDEGFSGKTSSSMD